MHCKVSHKAKLTYVVLCPCKPLLIYQPQDGTVTSPSDTLGLQRLTNLYGNHFVSLEFEEHKSAVDRTLTEKMKCIDCVWFQSHTVVWKQLVH